MQILASLPDWTVLHVPHDSTQVPDSVRDQFVLDDLALQEELIKMTDHHTLELFASGVPKRRLISAQVSRLVVDVERFENDELESMSSRGMGAVYTRTSSGQDLRRKINAEERRRLIRAWYEPHHSQLERAVQDTLEQHKRVLIVDAHSFPSVPLPYETCQEPNRPEICIGTDDFHTPHKLTTALAMAFENDDFTVAVDTPFAGSIVPVRYFQKDSHVSSVMIEVRRDLYINEKTGLCNEEFGRIANRVRACLCAALASWERRVRLNTGRIR